MTPEFEPTFNLGFYLVTYNTSLDKWILKNQQDINIPVPEIKVNTLKEACNTAALLQQFGYIHRSDEFTFADRIPSVEIAAKAYKELVVREFTSNNMEYRSQKGKFTFIFR
jgi:hypothetical protein